MPQQPTPGPTRPPTEQTAASGRLGAGSDMAVLFPALDMRSARRRRIRRRIATLATATIVLAATGVGIARATDATPAGYTTVDVTTRDVDTTLDGVASIEPVAGAQVAFPIAGTVTAVDVAVNDTVTIGQVLATLDTTELTTSLHAKQAALDKANLILTMALAGDDVSSLTAGSFGSSYVQSASAISRMLVIAQTTARTSAVSADIAAAQQAVLTAQHDVDTDIDTATTTLTTAATVCAAISVDATATDPTDTVTGLGACQTALDAVLDAQGDVAADQTRLAAASTALDALLTQAADDTTATTTPAESTTTTSSTTTVSPTAPTTDVTTTTSAPTPTTGPATSIPPTPTSSTTTTDPTLAGPTPNGSTADGSTATPSTSADTTPSGGGPGGGTGSGSNGGGTAGGVASGGGSNGGSAGAATTTTATPSAADLVSYQKAVDAATADVTEAEQAIAQATIVSPIVGTVVAIDLAAGDTTTASSTTQQIVIEGSGGFEATSVSLAEVPQVKVGQDATVLADGTTTPITGKVVAVSLVPTSTTTTTYGVVIALDGDTTALHDGAIGSYSLIVANTTGTLAVPTSAITTTGTNHTVTILDGATTTVVNVQVGVIGTMWTSITKGLLEGQHVVVADLSQPLPTSATASSNATAANTFPGRRT